MRKVSFIHPILFAVFPVLFLFYYNIRTVSFLEVFIPLGAALTFAVLLRGLAGSVIKDSYKAGIIVSVFLVLFFSYGHIYTWLNEVNLIVGGLKLGRHRYLFPPIGIAFVSSAFVIARTRMDLHGLTKAFTFASGALVFYALANIGGYAVASQMVASDQSGTDRIEDTVGVKEKGALPDIYYITLDAYANRGDLQEVYHYDNSEIYDYLERKGFFVPAKGRSNYVRTILSLTSALNMRYLDDVRDAVGERSEDLSPLSQMLAQSEVMRFLKVRGYKTVNISAYDSPMPYNPYADFNFAGISYRSSEFYVLLLKTTMLDYFTQRFVVDDLRPKILYAFAKTAEMPALGGPKFVFVHILSPHAPYLFDQNGDVPVGGIKFESQRDVWKARKEYVDQTIFINKKIKELVDVLLTKSSNPPIIILQSDHGSAALADWENPSDEFLKERLRNFQAYYLPGGGEKMFYDSVTLVNAFRIILNYYFDANYRLLEDKSYFSPRAYYYQFRDVTDIVKYR